MTEAVEQTKKKSGGGMKQMLMVGLVFAVLAIGFGLIKVFTPKVISLVPGYDRKTKVDFTVTDLRGNSLYKISDNRGSVMQIKILRTTDELAPREIDDVNTLAEEYRDKRFAQLVVFWDDEKQAAAVKAFVEKHRINVPYTHAQPEIIMADGSTPRTILLDNQNRPALQVGAIKDFNHMRGLIDRLLAEEIR